MRQLHFPRDPRRRGEQGQALISTVVATSLMLLVLLATITFTQMSNRTIARQLTYEGQALNGAEAGIAESLSWFRGQNSIVTTFAPLLNTAATPPINDTECPTVNAAGGCPTAGIIRSYDVSQAAHLKGRYEAVIGTAGGTNGVVDITPLVKSGAPAGSVWQLESTGYVWIENDPSKGFNQAPNMIISKQTVRTQIQRMTVVPPAGGEALFAGKNTAVTIGAKGKLRGGAAYGYVCASNCTYTLSGSITGTAGNLTSTAAGYDEKSVFGVTATELKGLADVTYTQMSDVPNPLPAMNLIIFNGNAAFDATKPLNGSGIFVVYGDLSITGVTNSNFNGVLYVSGSVTIENPANVAGVIIANTSAASGKFVKIGLGSAGDIAEIDYDSSIVSQINKQMGSYRYTRGLYWVGK